MSIEQELATKIDTLEFELERAELERDDWKEKYEACRRILKRYRGEHEKSNSN